MDKIPYDIEKRLKAIIRRIEYAVAFDGIGADNFKDKTSMKSLIEITGMSERSLRKWFKLYTGQNVSKYANSRRAEYAARIFRLFPTTSKSEVAQIIGLNSSTAIYPFMRKHGVNDIDHLKNTDRRDNYSIPFRFEQLPNCIMFYMQDECHYNECSNIDFELSHWEIIEKYVINKYPQAEIIGYIGFAIDKYLENDIESGIFISGILYKNTISVHVSKNVFGEIGSLLIPSNKYAVFSHRGTYEELSVFYQLVLDTLHTNNNLHIKKSSLIMEKYINSPTDTPAEELSTEIWIPLIS